MSIEIDLKTILGSYVQLTLFTLMLSVGLSSGFAKLSLLGRNPSLLLRAILAAFVLVPLAAILIAGIIPMGFPLRIGLAMMAICPGAPMIYRKALKGRARPDLAGSYQVTMCLLTVVFVPFWLTVLSKLYPADGSISAGAVLKQVALAQLIPITLGLVLRQWFPKLADDLNDPIKKLGNALLIGMLVLLLVGIMPKALSVGPAAIAGAILFAVSCIMIGHVLGGPEPEDRLTLGISNGSRNAGLALAVATANFADPGILGAIGAYALFAALGGAVYSRIYERKLDSQGQGAPARSSTPREIRA